VFLNRRSEPLTRFGIHEIVTRYARTAMSHVPEMRKKRIGPHTIRHYLPFLTMSSDFAGSWRSFDNAGCRAKSSR
jgi:integrase/recombinase XerD